MDINELTEELQEAEETLVACIKAARAHDTRGTTRALLKTDGEASRRCEPSSTLAGSS
jgi:hypothetical protein